jgi:hypothetical protein
LERAAVAGLTSFSTIFFSQLAILDALDLRFDLIDSIFGSLRSISTMGPPHCSGGTRSRRWRT